MSYNQSEPMGFEKATGDTEMMYVSGVCPYCPSGRQIAAEKTKWLIHLASHREDIIKHMTDVSTSCIFCAYPVEFANKKHAASHYRWGHQKSKLLNWALQCLPSTLVVA